MKVTSYYTQKLHIKKNFVQLSFWFMDRPHVIKRCYHPWALEDFLSGYADLKWDNYMKCKLKRIWRAGFSNSKNCIWREVRKRKAFSMNIKKKRLQLQLFAWFDLIVQLQMGESASWSCWRFITSLALALLYCNRWCNASDIRSKNSASHRWINEGSSAKHTYIDVTALSTTTTASPTCGNNQGKNG